MEVALVSPQDDFVARLQEEGFAWHQIDLSRRGMNPIVEARTLLQCLRLYRRLRPTLVQHFTVKPILYGSLAARLTGVPAVVNSVTGLGYVFIRADWWGRLLRGLVRPFYRLALTGGRSRVIFQNPQDQAAFIAHGLVREADSTVIRGSGVDVERFRPLPEPGGLPVVLMASRMLWDKGVGELVIAARLLKEREVPGKVILVGAPDPGNPSAIPERQLRRWVEEGIVEWQGLQEDMPEVYARSHIVALPSYREGLPRSLIEAAAAGRPIIATDVPGCREVVRHGVNGLLVPPKDPEALADALERLLTDPRSRERMGRRGREFAVDVFSDRRVVSETIAVYEGLLLEVARGSRR